MAENKIEPPSPRLVGTRIKNKIEEMSVCESEQNYECDCCGAEVGENDYAGCCRDGDCPEGVENLCTSCGDWNDEMWFCPKCVVDDGEENAPEDGECDKCHNKLHGGDNNKWGHEHGDYKSLCDMCYEDENREFCEEHEQVMYKDGMKCGGCLTD